MHAAGRPSLDAFFLPAAVGQRFALHHRAQGPVTHGVVVYVHPFAEEMNKSRRMAALQARALAQAGYEVLQLDLLGCGDSSGDFADATWNTWVDDVVMACQWLRRQASAPLWLWGLRAGCLLAAQAANQLTETCSFLMWSPTPSGKSQLQQFLRLKAAGDLANGNAKATMDSLRAQLAAGEKVEIAGYLMAADLATGMEKAALLPPAANGRLEWMELSTKEEAAISPASAKSIQLWQDAGFEVHSQVVTGPSFWQTSEIEEAPALITASLTAMGRTPTSVVAA